MNKVFINSKDLEKIASILCEIHGISPEEFVVDMNKWLNPDENSQKEFHIFPQIKDNSPKQKEKKQS